MPGARLGFNWNAPGPASLSSFGENMTLAFNAKSVSCSSAIGGEILQVCFDTIPASKDEDERDKPYVLISRNFEFPDSATVEWHDGRDYDGGAEIVLARLTRERVLIKLDRQLEIDVSFSIGDRRFAQLTSYLRRMLDDSVLTTTRIAEP